MNASELRNKIFQSNDQEKAEVYVPEWGVVVYVKLLTALERDQYDQALLKKEGGVNLQGARAKLVVLCTVDNEGYPVFTAGDIETINAMSARAVEKLFTAAMEINCMQKSDVEAIEKNL